MRDPVKGYYRFPTIHKNQIVFTAEGDLWRVATKGGVAQRLTTHHGLETHAAISPDGQLIAFSGQYEGPTEVYVMSFEGGRPLRLTYEDERAIVVGWTPDGKILYRTRRHATLPSAQLCSVDPQTFEHQRIPLAEASDGNFEEDLKTIYFTRLPFQGSYTKRYKGGTVQQIWKHRGKKAAVPLTVDYEGTSKNPLLWNGRIYFASDRDGTMNLWSMTRNGKRLKQHTFHKAFDIHDPKLHNGRIVYQWQADLYLYDIEKDKTKRIDISLASDLDQKRERWVYNPIRYVNSWHPSPTGDRVVFTTRGKMFVLPVEQGRRVEVTPENNGRFRNGQFTPDGDHLFAYSDETGELELYLTKANGLSRSEQVTANADVHRFASVISPNGKWVIFHDKNLRLWLTNLVNKETYLISESKINGFYGLSWAPDSHWVAVVELGENRMAQIKLFNVEDRELIPVTSDRTISYSPTWSHDGRWLYFLSDRTFHSIVPTPWGARQPEPFIDATTKIYALSLQKENVFPFRQLNEVELEQQRLRVEAENQRRAEAAKEEKNTAVSEAETSPEDDAKSVDDQSQKPKTIPIEFEGLSQRLYELPVGSGNYRGLSANDKTLFWVDVIPDSKPIYHLYAMAIDNQDPKPERIARDVASYDLTMDGKKILLRQKQAFYMIDAKDKPPKPDDKKRIDLSGWRFKVDLRQEWQQMLTEAWRLERDYFYDTNLHGIDWQAILERHLPLLDRVTDRDEFNHLLAQMVGELAALHTYVHSGDLRKGRDYITSGALGIRWSEDEANDGYRIDYMYRTDPDYPHAQGPLVKPQFDVAVGDVITEINGRSLLSVQHPAILLQNQANRQTRLKIKPIGKEVAPYEIIVKPVSVHAELNLRYDDWEYTRRLHVEEATQNRMGYVHLRAMGENNFEEWTRNYYPIFNRQGLILDLRHNRGGNIDSWILSRLMRQEWFFWAPRKGQTYWNMHYAFRGHMAVLVNGQTASDGEVMADGFRRLGLGKVIGTRTWGGEIWLTRNTWLADKGIATAAQIGVYKDGEWLIEGRGVEPDIVVDNDPYATFHGQDAQLDAAIAHLESLIKADPREVEKRPSYPDKSFDYFT
ncbi:MAG: S41 family peptidase [Chloroflexota bacterium]